MAWVELIHLASCVFMTGLIWFVQIVHYPMFRLKSESLDFFAFHQRRTSWVVLPPMLIELSCGLYLAQYGLAYLFALALLGAIWASTALLQVPCHNRLLEEYSEDTVRRLVKTNWIRTIAWTLRSCLLLWLQV